MAPLRSARVPTARLPLPLLHLLLLAAGARTAGAPPPGPMIPDHSAPCPPYSVSGFPQQPGTMNCDVITLAGGLAPGAMDAKNKMWREGVEMFAAHINAQGGLRLGRGNGARGVGYVTVNLTEVASDDSQPYLDLYKELCSNTSVNFLLAPLQSNTAVTVLNDAAAKCPGKVYLAADAFDKLVDARNNLFSVYGVEQTQWGEDPIDLLYKLGARSFAIAGKADSPDSQTRAALTSAIRNRSATCYDKGLKAVGSDPLLLKDVDNLIEKNPDVFIGLGDSDTFTTLLKEFKKKKYAPKAAFFISGLAATEDLIKDSYTQDDCTDCVVYDQWMGTVPWTADMPYAGRKDWSALPDPYGDSTPGNMTNGVDRRWSRYAGSASEFARVAGIRLGRAPTYYHAKAAATLLMLQMAVELAPETLGVHGGVGMNQAFSKTVS